MFLDYFLVVANSSLGFHIIELYDGSIVILSCSLTWEEYVRLLKLKPVAGGRIVYGRRQ